MHLCSDGYCAKTNLSQKWTKMGHGKREALYMYGCLTLRTSIYINVYVNHVYDEHIKTMYIYIYITPASTGWRWQSSRPCVRGQGLRRRVEQPQTNWRLWPTRANQHQARLVQPYIYEVFIKWIVFIWSHCGTCITSIIKIQRYQRYVLILKISICSTYF